MFNRPYWLVSLAIVCAGVVPVRAQEAPGEKDVQEDVPAAKPAGKPKKQDAAPAPAALPSPEADHPPNLLPVLPTVPVSRGGPNFNHHMVDASVLPRDRAGIWVLNFTFKPLRIIEVDVPGKGRENTYYLYYKVVNRTGRPIQFVPQFTLVTDGGKRYDDVVLPQAVKRIQAKEEPTIPLLGAVSVMGVIPPSKKEGVDDAVFGVAVWDKIDPAADGYHIYVRGLSDGFQTLPPPAQGKPIIRYKTLRIDFIRRGDEHRVSDKEIQLGEPPYEWIYW